MNCDALACWTIDDHDPEFLEKELKFTPDGGKPFNWYLLNYSLGENVPKAADLGLIMV